METFITSLSEGTLPNFVGHIMNSTSTGYHSCFNENPGQYLSFVMNQVLEVYEGWKDFHNRFWISQQFKDQQSRIVLTSCLKCPITMLMTVWANGEGRFTKLDATSLFLGRP